jgi:hypothetical protein
VKLKSGLSLAETVIASFVLLSVFAITASLFHSALRYSVSIEQQVTANRLAVNTMEQVRSWSSNYGNWAVLESTYGPQTIQQDPFRLVITAQAPLQLASPCHSMEAAYPVANRKLLNASIKPVQIDVLWEGKQFSLNTLIAEPRRTVAPALDLTVTAGNPAALVPQSGSISYTVLLKDSGGNTIPDIQFKWYTEALSGDGTVDASDRKGLAATFSHQVRKPGLPASVGFAPGSGPALANPSTCRVNARAVYYGQEVVGNSTTLSLQP